MSGTHTNWVGEELTDEEYQELIDEEREYWANQDPSPEQVRGEVFQDKYNMYKREY